MTTNEDIRREVGDDLYHKWKQQEQQLVRLQPWFENSPMAAEASVRCGILNRYAEYLASKEQDKHPTYDGSSLWGKGGIN